MRTLTSSCHICRELLKLCQASTQAYFFVIITRFPFLDLAHLLLRDRLFSRFIHFPIRLVMSVTLHTVKSVFFWLQNKWRVLIQYWSLLNWQNLRLRCGCVAVPVNWFFALIRHVLLNLRTLYIVWSLVRRRVARRLTRLQTMCNVLKYGKIL